MVVSFFLIASFPLHPHHSRMATCSQAATLIFQLNLRFFFAARRPDIDL